MRRTKRRRSRACQIAPARGAQTALARRPPRRTAGRRGRPTRRRTPPMLPQYTRTKPAAAACVWQPSQPTPAPCRPRGSLHGVADQRMAAALRPALRPARRGKQGRMSRGQPKLEARAAGRQQKVKSGQVRSGQVKSSHARDTTPAQACIWLCEVVSSRRRQPPFAPCAPPALLTAARPAPITCASARRPLRTTPAARRPPPPASVPLQGRALAAL